ncbi:MAG: GNAT family N-acetyltransferase [Methyloligellaceae bacterium]
MPHKPEIITADTPPMFVPLIELENLVLSTWYINVLAVLPGVRDLGLGTRLLNIAEVTATNLGKRGMSLIVADGNTGAQRLYERKGYAKLARRPIVKGNWKTESENWVLMTKDLI